MKKVLIHLGLPKTATTSLQHNVLQPLHDQGIINFLGKNIDFCEISTTVKVHNYTGRFIRDVVEGKLTIEEGRRLLETHLVDSKLNVFSDEGIMVAYPNTQNLPLADKFKNLKVLLDGYNVHITFTLRDPVDYFYSLYVQLHPDYYAQIKPLNTFEKLSEKLFKQPEDILFESFFYDKYLPQLTSFFDVTFTYFEDLKKNNVVYYQSWAQLLEMDTIVFQDLFERKHINKKSKKTEGSNKLFSLKFIEVKAQNILSHNRYLFNVIKRVYNLIGLKKLLNTRLVLTTVHKKPSGEDLVKLNALLSYKMYNK